MKVVVKLTWALMKGGSLSSKHSLKSTAKAGKVQFSLISKATTKNLNLDWQSESELSCMTVQQKKSLFDLLDKENLP